MPVGLKDTYFKDFKKIKKINNDNEHNNEHYNNYIFKNEYINLNNNDISFDESTEYNNYDNKCDIKLYSDNVKNDINLILIYFINIKLFLNDNTNDKTNDNTNDKILDILKQINVILIKYKVINDNNYTEFLSYIENNIDYFQICNRINEIIYYFKLLIENYGILILQYINSEKKRQEFFCYQLYIELRRFRRKDNENIFYIYNNISSIFQKYKIIGVHKYFNISKIIETINCLDEYYIESKKKCRDRIFKII